MDKLKELVSSSSSSKCIEIEISSTTLAKNTDWRRFSLTFSFTFSKDFLFSLSVCCLTVTLEFELGSNELYFLSLLCEL